MMVLLLTLWLTIYPVGTSLEELSPEPYKQEIITATGEQKVNCPKCGKECILLWGKLYDRSSKGGLIYHECPSVPVGEPYCLILFALLYARKKRRRDGIFTIY